MRSHTKVSVDIPLAGHNSTHYTWQLKTIKMCYFTVSVGQESSMGYLGLVPSISKTEINVPAGTEI